MTCELCQQSSGVYNFTRICCVARYCLSLPTKEQAAAAASRYAKSHGHDEDAIRAEAKRIRDERIARFVAR